MKTHMLIIAAVAGLLGLRSALAAEGFRIQLDPPGNREFVLDKADLLTPQQEQAIRESADRLLTDKATPIVVVTIESMADHGGKGLRIETFAKLLFDQWGVGQARLNGRDWNTGLMLLVSVKDRKARIEYGAGWTGDHQKFQQIMDEQIIPRFKAGDFPGGILAGVESMERVARGLSLPSVPRPWWYYAMLVGAVALAIFTFVSLARRGASGWAWVFWGLVFAGVGYVLYSFLTSGRGGRGGGGGGGFSGGSFGGGFSGGGASGSW